MADHRDDPALRGYVARVSEDEYCNGQGCPECHGRFEEPDSSVMEAGETDYVVCPHCGTLLALDMSVEVHFYERVCTPEEFAYATGEEVASHGHE